MPGSGSGPRRTGRNSEALGAIEQLLSLEKDNHAALKEKARILEALDRDDEALSVLASAQDSDPDDAEVFQQTGELLRKKR